MNYLLDTHVWVWLNGDPERLSPKVRRLLSGRLDNRRFLLSVVSIAELATLVEKQKVRLLVSLDELVQAAVDQGNLQLVPVTHEIALETGKLRGFSHYDPADRIIVATARVENATILTADRTILSFRGVKAAW